jgi:glyoxylase-like metal-dependent hydrolase (beta-lactamase superfamily II)
MDYANRRALNDFTRVPKFITAVTTPQRTRNGLDGDVAYNIAPTGAGTRLAAQIALDRQEEMLYHPVGFIRAAYGPGVVVSETRAGAERLVKLRMGRKTYTMAVDNRTNLPSRIDNTIDNPMLGDAVISNRWSGWRDVSGVKLPMRLAQKLDRWDGLDLTFATAAIDADVASIAASDSVRALPLPPATPAPTLAVEELAPGVWWIGGGTHHSIAIEQADRIVLIEAPQSEDRATAVIGRARTLAPNKPVTTVINTHHHFDHAGGLRAAMAQGLEIITHEGNRDFYERYVYARPHSIAPEGLATMTPVQLQLSVVRDKRVLNDANHPIEIYTVPGNPHVGTMLMVYLPKEKILVQADMYNPPAANAAAPPSFPFAANLLDNVKKRGLQVERVVGIHGRPVPLSEVEAAAAKKP